MGFRPMPEIESTLIKYNVSDPKSSEKYVKSINDFLLGKNFYKIFIFVTNFL